MPRLPRRAWRIETQLKTRYQMREEANFRASAKGINDSIIRMIDRIDPLEMLACAATTFLIYDLIKSVPEMLAQAQISLVHVAELVPTVGFLIRWLEDQLTSGQSINLTDEQKAAFQRVREQIDPALLVKSFALAYILVHNSSTILNGLTSAGSGLTSYVAGALGLGVKVV